MSPVVVLLRNYFSSFHCQDDQNLTQPEIDSNLALLESVICISYKVLKKIDGVNQYKST